MLRQGGLQMAEQAFAFKFIGRKTEHELFYGRVGQPAGLQITIGFTPRWTKQMVVVLLADGRHDKGVYHRLAIFLLLVGGGGFAQSGQGHARQL